MPGTRAAVKTVREEGAACNCAVVSGGADLTVHGPPHGGHENGRHEKLQLISSTEHWAILSASPMLQPPSRLTSQTWGFLKGARPHVRRSTVYWAMTSASPMFTTPSPFTSPHKSVVVVVLVVDVVLVVVVGGRVVVVELVVVDVVVVGNGSVDRCSNAPISHRPPEGCGRDTLR